MKRDGELILNIGCGEDRFGDVRLDLAPTSSTTIVADAQSLPFRDSVFERTYERNLLEHLPNPGKHLSEVNRVMKPGGLLNLVTDNAACLKYYILGTHTGGYRKREGKDRHYALFTAEHVRNLMKHAGIVIEKISYVETGYFTWLFDRLVRVFAPSLSYPRILVEARKP